MKAKTNAGRKRETNTLFILIPIAIIYASMLHAEMWDWLGILLWGISSGAFPAAIVVVWYLRKMVM